jgi:hypothetical protein
VDQLAKLVVGRRRRLPLRRLRIDQQVKVRVEARKLTPGGLGYYYRSRGEGIAFVTFTSWVSHTLV